jgi:hypothetical protein
VYRKPPGHQTDLIEIELPYGILSLKQKSTENRKRILNISPLILYPAKLSLKIDIAINAFHDKQKLK